VGVSIRQRRALVLFVTVVLATLGFLIVGGIIPGFGFANMLQRDSVDPHGSRESERVATPAGEAVIPPESAAGVVDSETVSELVQQSPQEVELREISDRVTRTAFLRAHAGYDVAPPAGRIISPAQPRLATPDPRGREILSAILAPGSTDFSDTSPLLPLLDPASEPFLREILPLIRQDLPEDPTVLFPEQDEPEVIQVYLVHPGERVQLVLYLNGNLLTDVEILPITSGRIRSLSELTSSEEIYRTILP